MISRETHWLLGRIGQPGDRDAILYGEERLSYARLHARITEWFAVLDKNGVRPGSVVGIRSESSVDACALLLSLVFNGSVAVPLTSGREDPTWYFQTARAAHAITAGNAGEWSWSQLRPDEPPPLLRALQQRGDGGLVVFSSGTTGVPKAGLFDFETLIKRYREPRRGHRTLLFLKLDHLGGIHTMLHTLANGGTVIITEDRRPEPVCVAIERHRVELLPTTPTFLRMLAMSGVHQCYDLGSLKLITYGTEPMPASTLRALTTLFPNVRFKQTYGLSELGVLPTRSPDSNSLWLQIGGRGCETRVVDNVLWIRSETAMLGYLNASNPFDEGGWYNTEDAVDVDGSCLRILGRLSELINVGGQKVYPAEVENVLLDLDNICEATVWGRPNAVTGQVVAARLTLARPEDHETLERRVHRFCRGRLEPYKIPLHIEIIDGDHHGKRFKKIRPTAPTGLFKSGARNPGQQRCTASS
jgi:long-chain acyl-CoA synthetase